MKNKTMRFLALIACTILLHACGGGGGESYIAPTTQPSTPAPATAKTTDFTKFQAATPTTMGVGFWQDSVVHDESVLPIAGKTDYVLLRDVVSIVSVRNRQTGQAYTPNTDYSVSVDGHFVIPAGSQIPTVPANWTSTPDPTQYSPPRADGSLIRVSADYQNHQIAVTYQAGPYTGSFLGSAGAQKLLAKLRAGQKVAITYIGDSITYGSTSTWDLNEVPHQHGYAEVSASYLAAMYPNQVYYRNESLAGSTAGWGAYVAPSKLGDTPSDLVVIAFGMNDSGLHTSQDSFTTSLRGMVAAVKSANPNTEIALVASWPSNPDLYPQNWECFVWYSGAINQVANETPGVFVVNMTSPTWDYILKRKSFYDITSNGMNHPSDWMATVYAQVVMKSILGN